MGCCPNLDVLSCRIDIVNKSCVDGDILVGNTINELILQLAVTQIDTDYVSLYIISAINAFSNGTTWQCPVLPRNFSVRSFALGSEFIPLQMFSKRNSYLMINGTFLNVARNSNPFLGNFFFNVTIERIKTG